MQSSSRPGVEIRRPRASDLGDILHMAQAFHQESWYAFTPFSQGKVADLVQGCLADEKENRTFARVFVADGRVVGYFLAVMTEHYWGHGAYAADLGLYILPEYRGGLVLPRILNAYYEWAQKRGALECVFGISSGIVDERIAKLVERMGFSKAMAAYSRKCIVD